MGGTREDREIANNVDGVNLSRSMMSLLIAHASGDRAMKIAESETLRALKARGLIRYNRLNKPSHTIATPRGREVIQLSWHGWQKRSREARGWVAAQRRTVSFSRF